MDFSKEDIRKQSHQLLGQETVETLNKNDGLLGALRVCCIIPQRFLMGILCFLGIFNAYTLRVCLNLAITQMVNHTKTSIIHVDPKACPSEDQLYNTTYNKTAVDKPLQRLLMGILCFLGIFNAYTLRVCLNLAITQMVNHTKTSIIHVDPKACPSEDQLYNTTYNKTAVDKPYAIFDWDEATQGFVLSGFYYGYAVSQLLGGVLSDRFGAKWVLGSGLFSTTVFTFLIPIVTRWGGSNYLFALRVIQGIGEGPCVPALMTIMSRWVPPNERSFQGALIFGGAHLGNVVGSSISGILLSGGKNWANVFYFFGFLALLWCLIWALLSYSTPSSHPFISGKELEYLNSEVKLNPKKNKANDPVPWKAILQSKPVWALVAAAVGHDWGYYTLLTDLPKYSHDILKFDIASTGYLVALPFISLWISSFIFGVICDYCIKKKYHSIKTGRIIHTSIATTGPAICIIAASYAGCNRVVAMTCFVLSLTSMGGFYSGMKVNTLDLAPNYTGTVTAILNTISTMAGIIAPYLIGILTPDSTLVQWRSAFWVCFAVMLITNIIYVAWAEGEQQWWDDIRQHGYPPGWIEKHGPLFEEKQANDDMKGIIKETRS